MTDDEFKTMLNELGTVQQALILWTVFWRWLFRPKSLNSRSWVYSETYPVIYVLG